MLVGVAVRTGVDVLVGDGVLVEGAGVGVVVGTSGVLVAGGGVLVGTGGVLVGGIEVEVALGPRVTVGGGVAGL